MGIEPCRALMFRQYVYAQNMKQHFNIGDLHSGGGDVGGEGEGRGGGRGGKATIEQYV